MRVVRLGLAAAFLSAAAGAQPTLDPLFGNHSVIQRDAAIALRGTAGAGEPVTVSFAGERRSTTADAQGRWSATFAARPAGGPYRIDVRGAKGSVSAEDVMVGDVWLCSGQSNMEWPLKSALNGEGEVASAKDPQLRLMKVPKNDPAPQRSFERVAWKPTTPDSARDFSAACYFMARSLRASHGVAIGAIDSSWGGTAVHSWMPEAAVRATGGGPEVDLIKSYRADPEGTARAYAERWSTWWRERSGDAPGSEPWRASDRLHWRAIPRMTLWEQWGDPAFADFNGAIWARARFTLTPQEAAQGATLHLGAIDDFDRSFVNGEPVGQTFRYDKPRDYALRPGLLKPSVNEVLVYVLDTGGGGGFWGPAEQLKLTFANGSEKPIGQGWEYATIPTDIGTPPLPPWDQYPGVTTLYNGMIASLGPIRVKGVAWYQGEADVGKPGYDHRLAAMMASWRAQFGDPKLPFLIVGLAGYGQPLAAPAASSWAALIDEQRKAAFADGYAVMVSAIDIGERNDIHPPNKQEVGRRLALAAEAMVYFKGGMTQPELYRAHRDARGIVLSFDKNLTVYGGSAPLGVELCGASQDSCRYANVRVEGPAIIVADDGKPATRVRYAWADYPIVNVYGPERLPAPPFEIAIEP